MSQIGATGNHCDSVQYVHGVQDGAPVEDDSSSASLYCNRSEEAGLKTTSAAGTSDAREALPNLAADLIIVELLLPNCGGLELM